MAYKPLPKPVTERTLKRRYAQLAETTHGRIDITTNFGKNFVTLHPFPIYMVSCLCKQRGNFWASWNLS